MRRLTTLLIVRSIVVAAKHAEAQEPTPALVGDRIIDGCGGPLIENGVVLVKGGKEFRNESQRQAARGSGYRRTALPPYRL